MPLTFDFCLIVSGSKRSAHSNAYFYGFFNNKRIVLFDTLLQDWESRTEEAADSDSKKDGDATAEGAGDEKGESEKKEDEKAVKKGCSNLEVVAVLSHELGHWSMNHVFKNIVLIQVTTILGCQENQ